MRAFWTSEVCGLVRSRPLETSVVAPLRDQVVDCLRSATVRGDLLKNRNLVPDHFHDGIGTVVCAAGQRPVFGQRVAGFHNPQGVIFAHSRRIARHGALVNEYGMLKAVYIALLIALAVLTVGFPIYGVIARMGW